MSMTQTKKAEPQLTPIVDRPERFSPSLTGRWGSFRAAAEGLLHVVRTQPNAWIELAAALVALGAGWWFRISGIEWAIIVVLIVLMLALEAVNTAIEAVVDLAAPNWHPLAKTAKDAAAGALLLTAIGSVIVAAIIFLPYLL